MIAFAATAIAISVGFGAPAAGASCPDEAIQASLLNDQAFQLSVLCLINQDRAQSGHGPVTNNTRLRRAASRYAGSMVGRGFFAHTSPDGTSITSRLRAIGYMHGAAQWAVGENLSWADGDLTDPAHVVESWMASLPHRENLLNPRFREIGIGVARGSPVAPLDPGAITVATEYGFRQD